MNAGGRKTLTAFFSNRADADEAVQALKEGGFAESDVRLLPGYERDPEADPEARGEPAGFWASLTNFFLPAADRYSYAEGLSRGGYLVSVAATDANHNTALDILDREGTIDMDESEASWRSEGWTGYEGREPDYVSPSALATGSLAGSTGVGATPVESASRANKEGAEEPQPGWRDTSHGRSRVRSYGFEVPPDQKI